MRNITYLDTIRHTPDMSDLSIKTTVHPIKHQLEGAGLFKKERNMMDIMAEHKNPFRGGMLNIKQDPLRGGNFPMSLNQLRSFPKIGDLDKNLLHGGSVFGDIVKGLSFLPIPFVSDLARTATLTGLVK